MILNISLKTNKKFTTTRFGRNLKFYLVTFNRAWVIQLIYGDAIDNTNQTVTFNKINLCSHECVDAISQKTKLAT